MWRNDSSLRTDAQTHVVSEIARLRGSIVREAAVVAATLNHDRSLPDDDDRGSELVGHRELTRQLNALNTHVAQAPSRSRDQRDLRAEFATLLSFAKTLRTDAEAWRAAVDDRLEELERLRTAALEELKRLQSAALEERHRLTAERESLMRRRDALQFTIDETAGHIAQANSGDCRHTLPVFRLGEALTVCSVAVLSPRRWFRVQPDWLVTLDDSRDEVRVTRSY
jgi:chromosome segregation ATPase